MLDKGIRLTGAWNSGKEFEEPPNIVIPMIEVLKSIPPTSLPTAHERIVSIGSCRVWTRSVWHLGIAHSHAGQHFFAPVIHVDNLRLGL